MPTEKRANANDISKTFIITEEYGTAGAYPPETLIFCKANFASNESVSKFPVIPVTFPTIATRKNKTMLLVQLIP